MEITKKLLKEITNQSVASAKKLVLQLQVYPFDEERIRQALTEVEKDIEADIQRYHEEEEDEPRY